MSTPSYAHNNNGTTSARSVSLLLTESDPLSLSEIPADVYSVPQQPNTCFVETLNRYGVVYFGGLTAVMYGTILCLSGRVYPDMENWLILSSTYLVVNILLNFYLCRSSRPFYTTADAIDLPISSTNFCNSCQIAQPPRCHHCPVCRHCIPKRDHHCFFTGVCVGEHNQGHFTVYCLQCGLGLLMGFAILSAHLSSVYYEVFSWDFYRYFPPLAIFDMLLGNIDIITFFSVVLLCGSLVSGIFSLILFSCQFFLVSCDATSHELSLWWHKRSYTLRFRPYLNLSKVFGRFWIIHFIFPLSLCSKTSRRKYTSKTYL